MATVSKWTPFGVALDITATGGIVTRTSATKFTVKINVSWETYYEGAQTNYGMTATSGGVTHTISAFNGTKRSSGSGSFTGTYSISGNGSATKTITVTFKNFNTDNDDSASKNVSFNVTVPAWTSYKVTYNANGGTGAPSAQTKTYGVTLTLSSVKPTRTNYTFKGWATSASATTAAYSAGGSYTSNAAITLYAVWELTYKKPSITNVSVVRTDAGDELSVKFDWLTYAEVETVKIELSSSEATTEYPITASGTNGSVEKSITGINPEIAYAVRITVTDSGGTWTVSRSSPGLIFAMDIKAKAKGVSFGKAAELDGYADFGYKTRHRDTMEFDHNQVIKGTAPDGTIKEAFNPQNANGNTVIGYDNYDSQSGTTNIYGLDILHGVSNIASPGTYRPYRRRGDTLTLMIKTAGYVTNSGKDVTFIVPLSMPIIGSPTVTVTSNNGFVLRQGEKYTHGSSASVYVTPDSYEVSYSMYVGVTVTAKFSDTTNVINNNAIGILWNGTITFS